MQKENVVVKNQVILNWFQDLQRLSLLLLNNLRGRSRIKYGMTTLFRYPLTYPTGYPLPQGRGGFTLIELLVVVLIIGILTAVALPQYQKVVVKSRVATIIPLIRSIAKAQEIYYLANGEYATNISDLDIDVPGNCTHVDFPYYDKGYGNGELVNCGDNYFLIDNEGTCVRANYCPGNNTSWDPCDATKDFEIGFCTSFHKNEKLKGSGVCRVFHDSAIGNYICTTFAEYIQQD